MFEPPSPTIPWPADAARDRLVADWHLWQRKGGHRTSTDDLLTAWLATHRWRRRSTMPPPRYLDLGCGIGSVMLMTAQALRPTYTAGVEAQEQSARMAQRSVAELPSSPTIDVRLGDIRGVSPQVFGERFDLVTGSPPYLPEGTGVVSPDPQRAACRFELRGGVEAYCDAAAKMLTDDGEFCLVFQTTWDARVLAAGDAAGLHLVARADIRTKANHDAPFLSVYAFSKAPSELETIAFATRTPNGELTAAYVGVRAALGLA